jgi:hypothetical protein
MLTKKQIWRRVQLPTYNKPRVINDEHEESIIGDITPLRSSQIQNEDAPTKMPTKLRSALSSSNLDEMGTKIFDRRTLRFSSTVQVLLIQERSEMRSLGSSLFWNVQDYQAFKENAINEIRETAKNLRTSTKKAMNYLYQPNEGDSPNSTPNFSTTLSSTDLITADGSKIYTPRSSFNDCEMEKISFIANVKPKIVKSTDPSERQNLWAVQWKKES